MTAWNKSPEYQRIMEILEDYWLSCPHEARVTVCMTFVKADGQTQSKRIVWNNPRFRKQETRKLRTIKKLSEVRRPECVCMTV